MKTKILFFVVLLALAPTFSTVSYGQAALRGLASGLLRKAVEKRNNAKALDVTNDSGKENNSTNSNDEVTLVVFGKAVDSEKATVVALRSAIEQAYGVFVSANTTILNDDLVKDEIVTISSGNIKSYKVLSDVKCEDGQEMVTVKATVCISKLISYAKSKGASTEFAGATFAQNMKMKELNKKNELQALRNMVTMAKELLPVAFDKKLSIADPTIPEKDFRADPQYAKANPIYVHPAVGADAIIESYRNYLNLLDGYYQMEFCVSIVPNDNTNHILENINNTLKAIALSSEERTEYEKMNMKLSRLSIKWPDFFYRDKPQAYRMGLRFRNSEEDINKVFAEFTKIFLDEFANFEIVDNLGNSSSFNGLLMGSYRGMHSEDEELFRQNGTICFDDDGRTYFTNQGSGLFKEGVLVQPNVPFFWSASSNISFYAGNNFAYWIIKFRIPASEISKYSDFKLMPKNKKCKDEETFISIRANNNILGLACPGKFRRQSSFF